MYNNLCIAVTRCHLFQVKPLCEETMKLKKSLTRMKDQVERIDQGTFDEYR